jgi:hypothetical protein
MKCHRLYWLCSESGRRFPAGVAFYNEPQGDYRLKVDTFPEDKVIYLKPISMTEGVINFRVEAAIRKKGVILHRAEIGVGHANVDTGYPVFMDIGPYSRALVMEEAV